MLILYMLIPLIIIFGIAVLVDLKNKKHSNIDKKIKGNEYKGKAFAEAARYQNINNNSGGHS